jgi:hypothetical protein
MKLRKTGPHTYGATGVNALLSRRWRDRAPYRTKRVYWHMLLLTATGDRLTRRFDKLSDARTWLDIYKNQSAAEADNHYRSAE